MPTRSSAAAAKKTPAKPASTQKTTKKSSEDDEFVVEKIINKFVLKGKPMYLIKWKNFGEDENTWEPPQNLHSELVRDFEADLKNGLKLEPLSEAQIAVLKQEQGASGSATRTRRGGGDNDDNADPDEVPSDFEEDEEENEDDMDSEDPDFSEESDDGGKRKRKRPSRATPKSAGKKGSAAKKVKSQKNASESGDESGEENNSVEGQSNSQNNQTGASFQQQIRRKLPNETPMALSEGTFVLREADFNMKKGDRPYLKDGIPIWRIDNRHLIQLFQRTKADDYNIYSRTDLYDSWVCTDASGLIVLPTTNVQRSHGRDSEVIVKMPADWISKMKKYEADQDITVTGKTSDTTTAAANTNNKENQKTTRNSTSKQNGKEAKNGAQDESEEGEEEEDEEADD